MSEKWVVAVGYFQALRGWMALNLQADECWCDLVCYPCLLPQFATQGLQPTPKRSDTNLQRQLLGPLWGYPQLNRWMEDAVAGVERVPLFRMVAVMCGWEVGCSNQHVSAQAAANATELD